MDISTLLNSVMDIITPPIVDIDIKIPQLVALTYTDNTPILKANDPYTIMEIIELVRVLPFDEVMAYAFKKNSASELYWTLPIFDAGRAKVQKEISLIQLEEVGVTEIGRCRHCSGKELVFAQKQTRSGDEPMTVFVRCVQCEHRWRQ